MPFRQDRDHPLGRHSCPLRSRRLFYSVQSSLLQGGQELPFGKVGMEDLAVGIAGNLRLLANIDYGVVDVV